MAGVAGGIARIGSGGDLDHGALWSGAHPEEQEGRAAPLLCVGRSAVRDRPVRRLSPGAALHSLTTTTALLLRICVLFNTPAGPTNIILRDVGVR